MILNQLKKIVSPDARDRFIDILLILEELIEKMDSAITYEQAGKPIKKHCPKQLLSLCPRLCRRIPSTWCHKGELSEMQFYYSWGRCPTLNHVNFYNISVEGHSSSIVEVSIQEQQCVPTLGYTLVVGPFSEE
ncbi:hypothetical protein CEXT_486191 [Caerostris extrusa]|uniref:Uncharacterized protein n=1 Tax=Caerostris extrusa TaxID=172846 RepID=A0AAV4N602_CAEEX|nr:hypothetical protein CEXT_486191 [Caerostris extrusa]